MTSLRAWSGVVVLLAAALFCPWATAPAHAALPWQEGTQTLENLAPVDLETGEKLRVLATTDIVADVVGQVGGDLIQVDTLLPTGTDPHTFEATPRDMSKVTSAHVIFANGAGLEEFLNAFLDNAGAEAPVVYVSAGIEFRQVDGPGDGHDEEEQHGEKDGQKGEGSHGGNRNEEADEHTGLDPHTWTSPLNVVIWVDNIAAALSALDPNHAVDYAAAAANYKTRLEEADAWIEEQVARIAPEDRKLVTDHTVLGYFADRYGFEQVGAVIPSFSTAAQPSAQEIRQLYDAIREHGVKAIFVGMTVSPTVAERLAEDAGIQLVRLYTGSLGGPGSGVETYLDYLRYNVSAIVEALVVGASG